MENEWIFYLIAFCIWALVFVLSIVGLFWNPAQIITAIIAAVFMVLFGLDYRKKKKSK